MSEHMAFLEALKANPADDTVRLVYADWLDDHNDTRSHYVRLVCSLALAPQDELLDAPAADELRRISPSLNHEWEGIVGGRFEVALLEFHPTDRSSLASVLSQLLDLPRNYRFDDEAETLVASTPTAIRTRLTCLAATEFHQKWSRHAAEFHVKPRMFVRPIPNPAHSANGLFDVTLRKLTPEFWVHWANLYKSPVSKLLNLTPREAANRVRNLPAILFRAVPFADLETTLHQTRRAFNHPWGELLPGDALEVVPHVAEVPQSQTI